MKWYLTKDRLGVSSVKNRAKPDIARIIDTGDEGEMIANARLIAAAPLMYEALKDLFPWSQRDPVTDRDWEKFNSACRKAIAALAAAGATDGNQ